MAGADDHTENDELHDSTQVSGQPRQPVERTASLVVIHGNRLGERLRLESPEVSIGRSAEAEFQIDEHSVSRLHCQIRREGDRFRLRDLGSTNRTYLNEQPVIEAWLTDGDHLTVGQTILKFVGAGNLEAHYHAEVHERVVLDNLTGLHNRRFFLDMLGREIARYERHQRVFSLAILDLDLFKRINDDLGHIAGDEILRQVGELMRGRVRRNDVPARIGGEEFAILTPETPLDAALELGEAIRAAVESQRFTHEGRRIPLTITAGVAEWRASMRTASDIMRRADEALYQAKRSGRNRVRGASD